MGNKHPTPNLDLGCNNILQFQKKLVSESFSKNELQLIYLLYLNLKSRSIHEGIDKESFYNFCQMPVNNEVFLRIIQGLWGQRMWQIFQKVAGREYIEFDEFVYSLFQLCRSADQEKDRVIFEMFNLGQKLGLNQKQKKEITKEEILTMLYNLPKQGIIVGISKKDSKKTVLSSNAEYDYSIKLSSKFKTHERLIMDDKKHFYIMPEHIKTIVDQMVAPFADANGLMNFEQFRKFLEKNPVLRNLVKLSMKPSLWTLNEKGYAQFRIEEVSYDFIGNGQSLSALKSSTIDSKEGDSFQQQQQNYLKQDQKKDSRKGSVSCFGGAQAYGAGSLRQQEGLKSSSDYNVQPGLIAMEGELLKLGKKTDMWIKRYYVLKDSCLISYHDSSCQEPINVIYLNRLYIEPYFNKGLKGFRIFHDSDYFKERMFYNKDQKIADRWISAVKQQAYYYDVSKKYERMQQLGKGKFSSVYLCRPQDSDEVLAQKFIEKKSLTPREREFLREEIQIIGNLNHPNVVVMKDTFETLQNMYIMMEVMQDGELFDHIKDYEISEREAALIVSQILEALQYLHACGIVHRDLKPENILVECDELTHEVVHVKLTDFGLSKIIVPGEMMLESCGTPAYVAPEVLTKAGYYKEVDVWSTGVILYTMLARALPFHSSDRKKTFKLIKESDPDLSGECWQSISKECKDFLGKMLNKSPKDRITIEAALKHPFIRRYEAYIEKQKKEFQPVIDQVTGQIKRPKKSSSTLSLSQENRTNILNKLQSMQQSQTDYAEMVDETGGNSPSIKKNLLSKLKSKPFHIQPGMNHHMEKLDSNDSVEDDIKDATKHFVSNKEKTKKQRLEEMQQQMNRGGLQKRKNKREKDIFEYLGHRRHHDNGHGGSATRTLQPIKGLDLGSLMQAEQEQQQQQQQQLNQQQQKKKHNLVILKTHRHFSDHLDEDRENEISL